MLLDRASASSNWYAKGYWGKISLDGLLVRHAKATPDEMALTDTLGPKNARRKITFSRLNNCVHRVARALRKSGLSTDSIIALRLDNSIESIAALLGVMRAGMIALPIPNAWVPAETSQLLRQVVPQGLLFINDEEGLEQNLALQVVARTFSVRQVFSFRGMPDGAVCLDFCMRDTPFKPLVLHRDEAKPAEFVTTIHPVPGESGFEPFYRTHNHCIAMGLQIVLASNLKQRGQLVSPYHVSSLVGLGGVISPWLLTGSCLHLVPLSNVQALMRAGGNSTALFLPWEVSRLLDQENMFEYLPTETRLFHVHEELRAFTPPPLQHCSVKEYHLLNAMGRSLAIMGCQEVLKLETEAPDHLLNFHVANEESCSAGIVKGQLFMSGPTVPITVNTDRQVSREWCNTTYVTGVSTSNDKKEVISLEPTLNVFQRGGHFIYPESYDDAFKGLSGVRDAALFSTGLGGIGDELALAVVWESRSDKKSLNEINQHFLLLGMSTLSLPLAIMEVLAIPRDETGNVMYEKLREYWAGKNDQASIETTAI